MASRSLPEQRPFCLCRLRGCYKIRSSPPLSLHRARERDIIAIRAPHSSFRRSSNDRIIMAQTAKARLLSSAVPANCPFLRMSSGTQLTNYMVNFGGQCPFLGMVESQASRSLCSASPSRPLKAPHANVQRQLPVFPLEALYNFQLDQAENDTDRSTIFPFSADQTPEQGSLFANWCCINY